MMAFDSTIIWTPPIRTWIKVSMSVPNWPEWKTLISAAWANHGSSTDAPASAPSRRLDLFSIWRSPLVDLREPPYSGGLVMRSAWVFILPMEFRPCT